MTVASNRAAAASADALAWAICARTTRWVGKLQLIKGPRLKARLASVPAKEKGAALDAEPPKVICG